MRPLLVRAIALASLAVAPLVACSDTVGPGDFDGTYDLERYEGQALPAVLSQTAAGSVTLISERLIISASGAGLLTTTIREVNSVTPQGANTTYSRAFQYTVRDARIEITYVCPPNADCIAGPHVTGELVDGRLALASPISSKPALIYRRVR